MTVSRPLSCHYCGERILRSAVDPFDHRFDVDGSSQIEKVWHVRCRPDYVPPDSPFQAALQKAKQAIEDARRLPAEEFSAFVSVVELALREQR